MNALLKSRKRNIVKARIIHFELIPFIYVFCTSNSTGIINPFCTNVKITNTLAAFIQFKTIESGGLIIEIDVKNESFSDKKKSFFILSLEYLF